MWRARRALTHIHVRRVSLIPHFHALNRPYNLSENMTRLHYSLPIHQNDVWEIPI